MIRKQEATGKTVDEARAKACALLGVQADDLNVSCEVLEMPQKDDRGVSTLYSLADFVDEDGARIRKDESYEKNYLIGKYGAIPTLKSIDMFKED